MAFPSASEVPTTSPSHRDTRSVRMGSHPEPHTRLPDEKRCMYSYILSHPRLQLHHPRYRKPVQWIICPKRVQFLHRMTILEYGV